MSHSHHRKLIPTLLSKSCGYVRPSALLSRSFLHGTSTIPLNWASFSAACKQTPKRRQRWSGKQFTRSCATPQSTLVEKTAVSTAVYDVSNKRVLLICRGKSQNYGLWAFPGGSVNKDEQLLSAAKRELMEETNIPSSAVSYIENPISIQRIPIQQAANSVYVIHVFAASIENSADHPPIAGDDAMDAKFFTVEEIRSLENCVPGLLEYVELGYDAIVESRNQ